MSKLIFPGCRRFFFYPEALLALFKLQAQIVFFQAGFPGESPGAKGADVPLSIPACALNCLEGKRYGLFKQVKKRQ